MKKSARKKTQALQPIVRQRKGPRWGQAHEQRGLNYADYAVALIQKHPHGKKFTSDDLDSFLEEQGLLEIPAPSDKSSDAWKAHVRRRDQHIPKLRRAGRHPRMRDEFGLPTFDLVHLGQDEWVTQAPEDVVQERQFLQHIHTYTETQKRHLDHLLQGVNFSQLPGYQFPMAEALYDDIDLLETMIRQHTSSINVKFTRIQQKIEQMVRSGLAPIKLPE